MFCFSSSSACGEKFFADQFLRSNVSILPDYNIFEYRIGSSKKSQHTLKNILLCIKYNLNNFSMHYVARIMKKSINAVKRGNFGIKKKVPLSLLIFIYAIW